MRNRSPRELSKTLEWFPSRACFRFKYRDPYSQKRRYLYCTPSKFREAAIELANPEAVRRQTKRAEGLARKLQAVFLASLSRVTPESHGIGAPDLTQAIEEYFSLYQQSPGYRSTLRRIFDEFVEVVGNKPCDQIVDHDLRAYETKLAHRVGAVTVRSYLRQLFMLISFCCKKGWLPRDPRLTYKLPRAPISEPNPFSIEELKTFFRVVSEGRPRGSRSRRVTHDAGAWKHLEWMAVGMLTLGLRPVELEHARWENVNWDDRFLFIARSHGNKEPQALQHQPIPHVVWPLFLERRQDLGHIWTSFHGGPCTKAAQSRARRSLQKPMPTFQWKRFRKTFATLLEQAGNDIVVVSRLLRQSAGGRNVTIAQRHYIGKSHRYLREVVDDAFTQLSGVGPFPSADAQALRLASHERA